MHDWHFGELAVRREVVSANRMLDSEYLPIAQPVRSHDRRTSTGRDRFAVIDLGGRDHRLGER